MSEVITKEESKQIIDCLKMLTNIVKQMADNETLTHIQIRQIRRELEMEIDPDAL